ncbi:lipopolysaccharide biosynthesis protein [Pedobacter sp. MR2016-24]|uniref:lipopolysaccharide biosynthesis protein n=1 Tax=Pedobacter sp. MR2016-24 TaxID=2994466 RepID=UPI0022464560|nr:polysaccharide biosynthesis protein [Pedobacter sp. MR2016-24]MCX2485280.1 polysaccharide biosynthesis protein [Pedobacter sp. MR2016-24]
MRGISQRILAHPKYSKSLEWGKLIFMTGAAQVLVQATGLLTGIFIIRMLPTQEYAFYTLANTMLGTMTILADGGISSGVMSQGGKIWRDRTELGKVLVTGMELRKKFAVFSLLVAVPVLVYLLWLQHAQPWVIILIVAALIPAFFSALSDSLLETIPKLHQDIKPLQANQAKVGLFRLFLSSASVFIFPFTFIALLANGIPRIIGNFRLRKMALRFADTSQPVDPVYQTEILKMVKRRLPGAIYYCLSGQITVWLISILGTTRAIAQVGALSRLGMVLSVFTVLFATLVVPRFARAASNKILLTSNFVKIIVVLVAVCTIIMGIVYVFPDQLLWILGKQYADLSGALLFSILGSCLALITGCIFSLSTSRGWVINPAISIPVNLITVVAGIIFMDISTLNGVLLMNIMVSSGQLLLLLAFFIIKLNGIKDDE